MQGANPSVADCQRRLEEIADVVRRLAHDFSNVLTSIQGFGELAQAQLPSGSKAERHLAELLRAAQIGTHDVQRLRIFTRRNLAQRGCCSLPALLREEEQGFRKRLGPVGLRAQVPLDLPALGVDAEAVRQVLSNLFDNAREAVPGEGEISLAARPAQLAEADCKNLFGSPDPGPVVEILVSDPGRGLTTDVQERLFATPFFSTKPNHRGMGLALVYGIVHAYRGGFRLDPGPNGRGAVARLYLPLAAEPARARAGGASGDRVLVVDDDGLILQLICSVLNRAGFSSQPAKSGAEALAHYERAAEPFRLVLTDLFMPQMDGVALARTLLDAHPEANVIFMSGQISEGFVPPNMDGRPFNLLPKPFHPDGLLHAVRSALASGPRGCRPQAVGV